MDASNVAGDGLAIKTLEPVGRCLAGMIVNQPSLPGEHPIEMWEWRGLPDPQLTRMLLRTALTRGRPPVRRSAFLVYWVSACGLPRAHARAIDATNTRGKTASRHPRRNRNRHRSRTRIPQPLPSPIFPVPPAECFRPTRARRFQASRWPGVSMSMPKSLRRNSYRNSASRSRSRRWTRPRRQSSPPESSAACAST